MCHLPDYPTWFLIQSTCSQMPLPTVCLCLSCFVCQHFFQVVSCHKSFLAAVVWFPFLVASFVILFQNCTYPKFQKPFLFASFGSDDFQMEYIRIFCRPSILKKSILILLRVKCKFFIILQSGAFLVYSLTFNFSSIRSDFDLDKLLDFSFFTPSGVIFILVFKCCSLFTSSLCREVGNQ